MTMAAILSSLMDSITTESFAWWFSRATLVAAVACAYLALARRAQPALRHAVAVAGLVAIAVLPLASALLPTLSVPVLPAAPSEVTPATHPTPFAIDAPAADAVAPAAPVVPVTTASVRPAEPVRPREPRATFGGVVRTTAFALVDAIDWRAVVVMTWLTVAAALLSWVAIGVIGARRLSRRAIAVDDDSWTEEIERARRVLGIHRTVDVGVSRDVAIPMVVGALRPRVVIPASATAWSRERLRVVLLHELAHVRRGDIAWMFVARSVTSLFWFHPLAWVLVRHVRSEAERACDDIVIESGVRGSDYAEHLVAIARSATSREALAVSALTLATRSSLENRVVSILATRVARSTRSRRSFAAAAAAALVMFVTIAAVQPTRVESARVSPAPAAVVEHKSTKIDTRTETRVSETVAPKQYYVEAPAGTPAPVYSLAGNDEQGRSGGEWYGRASDLYHNHRYQRAGEAYEKAAALDYRRETALYNAGCSYALADQKGKAIDVLRSAFEEGFDDPDYYASDEDLNSLRDDPRFKTLLDEVMNSDTAQASRGKAQRHFQRLSARQDVGDGAWNDVGMELLRSGDYEGASTAFANEFKVSKDEDALYNQACARSLGGKEKEALALLEQSITSGSVDGDHMAEDPDLVALHDDARFDQLVAMAHDLELNDSSWWKNAGGKWSWSGNDGKHWRKAVPHFQDMTEKYPKVGRAWFNLGYAQIMSEDAKSATPSFQKALDLGYKPSTTMYNLACSTALTGNIDGSIAWLEKAEKAGMDMSRARWDDDLDALHDDARFKAMVKRWRAESKNHDDWNYDDHHDKDDDSDT